MCPRRSGTRYRNTRTEGLSGDQHGDADPPVNTLWKTRTCSVAVRSQLNVRARSIPCSRRCARSVWSSITRHIAAAISSTECGSTRSAASPATSAHPDLFEVITGHPQAIASRRAIPNVSRNEGATSARAPRYQRASSSCERSRRIIRTPRTWERCQSHGEMRTRSGRPDSGKRAYAASTRSVFFMGFCPAM
jgi:hypothetical protein